MAAITHVGNMIVVGAAGTIDLQRIELAAIRIVATDSDPVLEMHEVTGVAGVTLPVFRFAKAKVTHPDTFNLSVDGAYGNLSVTTVIECSAWLVVR